jgi:hypothetical protein
MLRKYYVLCQQSTHSTIKTHLPVIAKDNKHAIRIARGAGLIPYGIIAMGR